MISGMSDRQIGLHLIRPMECAYDSTLALSPGWETIAGPIVPDAGLTSQLAFASATVHLPMIRDLLNPDIRPFGGLLFNRALNWVLVSTRGTETFAEWVGNTLALKIQHPGAPDGVRKHEGFGLMYNLIDASIGAQIAAARAVVPADALWIFEGHSLGGPFAMQACDKYGRPHVDLCVTWESPRLWNQEGAAWFDSRFGGIRFANFFDGVPELPPAFMGYAHALKPVPLHGGWGVKWNIAHSLANGVMPGLLRLAA